MHLRRYNKELTERGAAVNEDKPHLSLREHQAEGQERLSKGRELWGRF